jgi:hypothetical protein
MSPPESIIMVGQSKIVISLYWAFWRLWANIKAPHLISHYSVLILHPNFLYTSSFMDENALHD